MNIKEWLEENAELVSLPDSSSRLWVTKARGDYITRESIEDDYLLKMALGCGVTEYVSSSWEAGKPINIGFNSEKQKWYGWSHRAIYGFGIGSECKAGHCHYRPVDKDDFLKSIVKFWSDADHLYVDSEHRDDGVYIEWKYSQNVHKKELRGTTVGYQFPYPDKYGRGEWTAETLADARQMAIDFAEGVA